MDGTATLIDAEGYISRFGPKGAYDPADTRYYKTVNLYRLARGFCAERLVPALHAHIRRAGVHVYYEEVLGRLVEQGDAHVKALIVDGLPWYEIDTPADLRAAEALFALP